MGTNFYLMSKSKKLIRENFAVEKNYGVTDISDFYEVYDTIGRKRGFLGRGGVIDDDRVTDLIINDIKQGKISGLTFDRVEDYEF